MVSAFKTKRAELEEEVQEEAQEGACALMHKYFARKQREIKKRHSA